MIKDQQEIIHAIHSNSISIEKALDVLSTNKYLTHIFYTLHDNAYSGTFYPTVENKADFIHGAKEALDLVASAIYTITQEVGEKG